MEESTKLLPRERYYEKVKAALAALEGTDCILIARTNADPKTELDEGIERCRAAVALGAQMTTVVKLSNLADARYVASKVPGWKMYPDVGGRNGVAEVTVEDIYPLGFNFMTMHYTLKAAMDGMLEHGKKNFAQQGSLYTCDKAGCDGNPWHERHAVVRSARLHGTGGEVQRPARRNSRLSATRSRTIRKGS